MTRFLFLLFFLVTTGCQPIGGYPIESPYYQPPANSRLVLNQPIEIPPDSATVRFQFGKIVGGVNEFEPNCVFELTTIRETAQRVEPDTFTVTKVRSGSSLRNSMRQNQPGLMHARFVSDDTGGGPIRYFYKTEMFLHSARQPNVLMLTCQHAWETGSSSLEYQRPPTVAEMRQALGAYFTLQLPGI